MAAAGIVEVVGRAERNKRDKRARLIAAARELFRIKGFEQTTTSEIAERADVGKGTLFFHARSKDELLVMVFQEDMGRTIDRAFATVPKAPLLDQAMHVFNAMLKQDQREFELAQIFVKELAFVKGDHHGIDAVTEAFFSRMSVLIEQAQRRGEIKVLGRSRAARLQHVRASLFIPGRLARHRPADARSIQALDAPNAGTAAPRTTRIAGGSKTRQP